MSKLGNLLTIGATVITTAVTYELALIGTKALTEDVSYVRACAQVKSGAKNKKGKKGGRRHGKK